MATNAQRRMYLKDSPYTKGLHGKYGERLTVEVAERICREHCVTLGDMLDEGGVEVERDTVNLFDLMMSLGY